MNFSSEIRNSSQAKKQIQIFTPLLMKRHISSLTREHLKSREDSWEFHRECKRSPSGMC